MHLAIQYDKMVVQVLSFSAKKKKEREKGIDRSQINLAKVFSSTTTITHQLFLLLDIHPSHTPYDYTIQKKHTSVNKCFMRYPTTNLYTIIKKIVANLLI